MSNLIFSDMIDCIVKINQEIIYIYMEALLWRLLMKEFLKNIRKNLQFLIIEP